MSNLNLCDLSNAVGNEILCRMDEASVLLGLVQRDVSQSQITYDSVWPEQQFWSMMEVSKDVCQNLGKLTREYLYPLADSLSRSIEEVILTQLVKTLQIAKQIVPPHVLGLNKCAQWMTNYWQQQETSTVGRGFLLSPDCENRVLKSCSPQVKKMLNSWDWWMLGSLRDYVVAFQQQAITVTSSNLKLSKYDALTSERTLQYKDLCIQVTCICLPDERYRIQINWVGGITCLNLNHCGLIAEKAFTYEDN